MKQRFIFICIFLIIMAMLPFTAVKCSFSDKIANSAIATSDTVIENDNEKILCGLVCAMYDESYCTETIRAITILLNTNYLVDSKSFDLENIDIYIPENELSGSQKDFFGEIKKIVNSNNELYIFKDNQNIYIPYSEISNGRTLENENFISVASPWDCFSDKYDKDIECYGVSINGIDYLCKNGMDAIEALKWYLPDFNIKDVHNI